MPSVVTVAPARGEVAPAPWICAIVAAVGVTGPVPPTTPGVGLAAAKSAALSAVLADVALRVTAWVFEAPTAGPLPANPVAVEPYPTKSTTWSSAGQADPVQDSAVEELTSATLPAVPLRASVPVTAPVTGVVPPAPA